MIDVLKKYPTANDVKKKFQQPERVEKREIEGAEATVVVLDTTLGPAVGGLRLGSYPNSREAEEECFNLARVMEYKWLILSKIVRVEDRQKLFSGGKAVINDPYLSRTISEGNGSVVERAIDLGRLERLLAGFGKMVQEIGGVYYTAPDMNTDTEVMKIVRAATPYVKCSERDPSPITAESILVVMETLANKKLYSDLDRLRIVIQGVGKVGRALARRIREESEDARLVLVDTDVKRGSRLAQELFCEYYPDDSKIDFKDVDIFSPNARSGILDKAFVRRLKPNSVIVGAANHQVKKEDEWFVYGKFKERGIIYAPDYVANQGGICDVAFGDEGKSKQIIRRVGNLVLEIVNRAKATGEPTAVVADRICEEHYLEEVRRLSEI